MTVILSSDWLICIHKYYVYILDMDAGYYIIQLDGIRCSLVVIRALGATVADVWIECRNIFKLLPLDIEVLDT